VLEMLAYRDTWGKGADSFIAMIYERLDLMKDLLAVDGSIFVHCDWRLNAYLRLVMEELFGEDNFKSNIIWKRTAAHNDSKKIGKVTDTILYFSKTSSSIWNPQFRPHDQTYVDAFYRHIEHDGRKYRLHQIERNPAIGIRENLIYEYRGYTPKYGWMIEKIKLEEFDNKGMLVWSKNGKPQRKIYLGDNEEDGQPLHDIWDDIPPIGSQSKERLDYPTQKPEALIERIIKLSSNKDDIVADFFIGSGTTLSVAEKLGRKWIGADLGKFSIHTTRKRMIAVQRQMKKEGKDYRAFEILNLGKYERQHYIGINPNLRNEEKQKQIEQKEQEFVELIIRAYQAQAVTGFRTFQGKKSSRMVVIGPINLPVSRLFVEAVTKECVEKQITKVDILAFEFEMGLFPNVQEEARTRGVDVALKYIPPEVFDKRAIEKNQVVFYDVAYVEIKPHVKGSSVAVELTDFSVFYNQDSIASVEAQLGNGNKKLVVENGRIIKVEKDKSGIITRDVLTRKWTDWIDYWAVDFDFENKKEIIRVKKSGQSQPRLDGTEEPAQMRLDDYEEVWTGDYIFENEWQSFRTKKDRSLELKSVFHECVQGRRKIAVKVVDIFGNDTMKIVEVNI